MYECVISLEYFTLSILRRVLSMFAFVFLFSFSFLSLSHTNPLVLDYVPFADRSTDVEWHYGLHRLKIRPSLSRTSRLSDGSTLTSELGFSTLTDAMASRSLSGSSFTSRVGLDFNFAGVSPVDFSLGTYYDGIGTDSSSYGMKFDFRAQF